MSNLVIAGSTKRKLDHQQSPQMESSDPKMPRTTETEKTREVFLKAQSTGVSGSIKREETQQPLFSSSSRSTSLQALPLASSSSSSAPFQLPSSNISFRSSSLELVAPPIQSQLSPATPEPFSATLPYLAVVYATKSPADFFSATASQAKLEMDTYNAKDLIALIIAFATYAKKFEYKDTELMGILSSTFLAENQKKLKEVPQEELLHIAWALVTYAEKFEHKDTGLMRALSSALLADNQRALKESASPALANLVWALGTYAKKFEHQDTDLMKALSSVFLADNQKKLKELPPKALLHLAMSLSKNAYQFWHKDNNLMEAVSSALLADNQQKLKKLDPITIIHLAKAFFRYGNIFEHKYDALLQALPNVVRSTIGVLDTNTLHILVEQFLLFAGIGLRDQAFFGALRNEIISKSTEFNQTTLGNLIQRLSPHC